MPNHITTQLHINASEERKQQVMNAVCEVQEDGTYWFDFRKIIPMPSDLDVFETISMDAEYCAKYYHEQGEKPDWNAPSISFKHYGIVGTLPEMFYQDAKMMYLNLQKYGYAHALDWCRVYWKTKWNSYYSNKTEYGLEFCTAWSYPAPVILALSAMFPDVEFLAEYADEDIGYNCGWRKYLGGNIIDYHFFDYRIEPDDAEKFACRIKGCDYEECKRN